MTKTLAFMLSAALAACAGATDVRYGGGVVVRSPDLVTIEPDLYVVADADEPVFYTDNYYWLYRDNSWYRSTTYRGGWVRYHETPYRLRRIQQPYAYVQYRQRAGRQVYRNDRPDGRYYDRNQPDRRYYDRNQPDRRYYDRNQPDRRYDRTRDPYRQYPPGQVTPTRPEPNRPAVPNPRPPHQQPPVNPQGPNTPDNRVNRPPVSDTPADVRDRDHDRGRPIDQRDPGPRVQPNPPGRDVRDRQPERGPDRDAGSPNVGQPTPQPDRGAPVDRGYPDRNNRGQDARDARDRGRDNADRARGRDDDRDRRDDERRGQGRRERDR